MLFTNRLVNDGLEQAKAEVFTLIEALYFQEIKHIRETRGLDGEVSGEETKESK